MGLLEFEGEIEVMGKDGNERENESDEGDEEGWSFSCRRLVSQQSDADGDDGQPTQLVIISTSSSHYFLCCLVKRKNISTLVRFYNIIFILILFIERR